MSEDTRLLPYLETMATFSTANISRRDDELLTEDAGPCAGPLTVFPYSHGHFVRLHEESFGAPGEDDEEEEAMRAFGYSPELVALLKACWQSGVRWVRFDSAYEAVAPFRVFDW